MIAYRAARLVFLWAITYHATKVYLYGWGMAG